MFKYIFLAFEDLFLFLYIFHIVLLQISYNFITQVSYFWTSFYDILYIFHTVWLQIFHDILLHMFHTFEHLFYVLYIFYMLHIFHTFEHLFYVILYIFYIVLLQILPLLVFLLISPQQTETGQMLYFWTNTLIFVGISLQSITLN